jgi:hypothetical protein
VTWNPRNEGHEAAAGEWTVGDHVAARANEIKVRAGSRGTVIGFSAVGGHPLVDFAGCGLVLIRAEHLARDDDATTEARTPGRPRSPGTTRLSDTPRPRTAAAAPLPPPPDWFDRPPQPQVPHGKASTREQLDDIDLRPPGDLTRTPPHGAGHERRPDELVPRQERRRRAIRGAEGTTAKHGAR